MTPLEKARQRETEFCPLCVYVNGAFYCEKSGKILHPMCLDEHGRCLKNCSDKQKFTAAASGGKLVSKDALEAYLGAKYTIEKSSPLKLMLSCGQRFPLEDVYKDIMDVVRKLPEEPSGKLPCKIGDRVWAIRNWKGVPNASEGIVSEMFFNKDMELMIVVKHIARGKWGEKVFATQEDAEAHIVRI